MKAPSGTARGGAARRHRRSAQSGARRRAGDGDGTAGAYRFPALPPGRYEVTATLQGFSPARLTDVRPRARTAAQGRPDAGGRRRHRERRRDGRRAAHRRQAECRRRERRARDHRAHPQGARLRRVVTSAPGITDETRNRGIQIDGASGADNRFMIDGVDTTNLLNGTSGKALAPEFVAGSAGEGQRLQRRVPRGARRRRQRDHEARRQPVPRRRWASTTTSDGLHGDVRPTLRLSPTNQNVAEYVTTPPDDFSVYRAGRRSRRADPARSPVVLRRLQPARGRTRAAP